jgi:peptide/nickel transport system ATP-binding protein
MDSRERGQRTPRLGDPPVLEMVDVHASYRSGGLWARQQHSAIRGVSLAVAPGEMVGLVGDSGSGKTTMSKLALGLMRPDSGSIRLNGGSLQDRRKRNPGMVQVVLQHPEWALDPFKRVSTSVAEPLVIARGGSVRACRDQVLALLDRVGISEETARRFPHQLSGGQQQRAAVARALVAEPQLVVFDEAVSALDVSAQAQVLNLICETRADLGYAGLFISHDRDAVEYVSDRVARIANGQLTMTREAS